MAELSTVFGTSPIIALTIVTIIMALSFTLMQKRFTDAIKMRHLKSEMKKIQQQIKKAQSEKKENELKKLWDKSITINGQYMRMSMKPMIGSIVIVLIAFPLIAKTFAEFTFQLPFSIPLLASTGYVGWLGYYIIISIPVTIISRKLLGIDY